MSGIQAAQAAQADWERAVALATGGKVFSTHGCDWAWQPTRSRLVLLFPEQADDAGIRPGLAEGSRLGARRVDALLNAAAGDAGLRTAGFRDAAQIVWFVGRPSYTALRGRPTAWEGRVRVTADVPEAGGAEATELETARAWRRPPGHHNGRRHPAADRRIEHAVARAGDGSISGRGFAQFSADGAVSLHGLAVAATTRRQGVGSQLVAGLLGAMTAPLVPAADSSEAERPSPSVLAAAAPASSEFFAACGLEHLGRGRHLRLSA
ncbi:N-acetyltransferase [Zhihengliuella halotolerans]|uniref:N-acetyltransferase n=1 Tax=Zhihengliuella halotolerans TaxID=370736 RepID=UPI000C8093C2|nr:N-acetyltransferase [Zhihengliuella halotolerans]